MARRTQRWKEHRAAATAVRLAALTLPAALSGATAVAGMRLLPAPTTLAWALARLAAVLAASAGVMAVVRVATRRLLPLGLLLSLSLAFPDETPKRLRLALRAPSARRLADEVGRASVAGAATDDRTGAIERILGLVAAISNHHRLTRGHSERVRAYADLIAVELQLDTEARSMVRWAALLHDLGKLTVPTTILDKPGRPDEREWAVLSGHPAASARLAAPLRSFMGEWWFGIGQHHERWDGSGYPDGLAGRDIALSGRIVALADAFETMTATRSYKRPMGIAEARREVVACAGTHFDPDVVRAFLNIGLGRLHRVAGIGSWLPLPLVLAGVAPLRLVGAVGQTAATVAVSAATVAGGVLTAPASALAADPTAPTERASAPPAIERLTTGLLAAAAGPAPPGEGASAAPPSPAEAPAADGATAGPAPTAPSASADPPAGEPATVPPAPGNPAASPSTATGAEPPTAPTTARPAGSPAATATPTGTAAPPATTAPPATAAPPATTAPTGPALSLANDVVAVAPGASATVWPLANDVGHDSATLRIVRADRDVTAVVQPDGSVLVTLAADAGDQGNTVRYRVCAPAGAPCAEAVLRVLSRT